MSWPSWVLMLLLVAGCRDAKDEGPTVSAPPPTASSVAKAPAKAEDDSVVTVDDTVPAPDPSPDDGADDEADDEEETEVEEGCAPPGEDLKPLQLLRFEFTSGIEGKDPKDKLFVARPGQRVYAHLTLRNRSGRKRCAKLTFRVGGKKRTEVTLKIGESWSWRTWAFNTVKAEDRGRLELTVTDGRGDLILKKTLPVVPE